MIRALPSMKSFGTVLVDDFHRLPAKTRSDIADLMKILADEETEDCKVVLIGINKADLQSRRELNQVLAAP